MSRIRMIVPSLLAISAYVSVPASAQETTPATAPSGESAKRPPEDSAPPRRPNAQGGGNRRDAANLQVPDDIQLVRDVVYATVTGKNGKPIDLKMDCAFPKESDVAALPVIMYIHGGGWSGGDRGMGLPFSLALARGDYFACTVSYRLSGEAIFPAQIHDVKAAVRFIRAHAEELAIDPNRIGVWGHSAGGHLSALLGVTGNDHSLDGPAGALYSDSSVQAVVDVSGPTDLLLIAPGGDGGPLISQLLGGTVRDKQDLAKLASPVNHVDANDAPILIIQGGEDRLVPDEQAEVMRDALKKAGVECEYLYIPEAGHGVMDRRAFQATAEFFDKYLGGHAVDAIKDNGRRLPGAGGGGGGSEGGDGGGANRPRRPDAQPKPATKPQ